MNDSTPTRFGVTGASGKVGAEVARLLAGRIGEEGPTPSDRELRLIVRSAERAPHIDAADGVDVGVHEAVYSDREAAEAAFAGLDVLLLVSAAESEDRRGEHRTVIDAAVAAGVGHIVYTSFLGADPFATFMLARDHDATETMLRESGIPFTFLRDSFYADVLPDFAGEERVIRGPGGTGRCAYVARRDVAEVAAAVMVNPSAWENRTLDLTGPTAVTFEEAAAVLTDVYGDEYGYVDETFEEALESRASYGAPEWLVDACISTYTAVANGELDVVSGDMREVLGREPRDLAEALRTRL